MMNILKKLATCGLSLTMVLSLAACGGSDDASGDGGDGEAVDITEELAETGRYHAVRDMTVVREDGGEEVRAVTLDVTGAPGDWTAVQDNGDGIRVTITSQDAPAA